jgi:hypothetical protein
MTANPDRPYVFGVRRLPGGTEVGFTGMPVAIGNPAIPGYDDVLLDDYFPIDHDNDIHSDAGVLLQDELGAIENPSGYNRHFLAKPRVIAHMDFDGTCHIRQTANIHAAPKAGAFRLKQGVAIKDRQNPPEYANCQEVEIIQTPQARHQQAGQGRKRGVVEAKDNPFQKPGERGVGALETKKLAIEKIHFTVTASRDAAARRRPDQGFTPPTRAKSAMVRHGAIARGDKVISRYSSTNAMKLTKAMEFHPSRSASFTSGCKSAAGMSRISLR